jgi:tryptophan-rich sensory protein
MKPSSVYKLITAIVVSELAGIIGAVFTVSAIQNWYATLAKPALNPPSWIFGPVWTTLYALMGIAVFLVWNQGWDRKEVKKALGIFALQLILNGAWSVIFFGLQNPPWAFMNLVLMWLAIISTMVLFHKISKPAMWLLLPYILWVSFAGYLNLMIWILN